MKKRINRFIKKIFKLTLIAALIGFFIGLYKIFVHHIIELSTLLLIDNNAIGKTLMALMCVVLIFLSYSFIKLDENIAGNGIPQFKINAFGKKSKFNIATSFPLMFFNSSLSFFLGFPLGSEAPSVYLGGCIGLGVNRFFDDSNDDDTKIAMGAGFASAFVAPITGFFYIIEETLRFISLKTLVKTIYVLFVSYIVTLIVNPEPIFRIDVNTKFNLSFWYVFVFVIIFNFVISFIILYAVPKLKSFMFKNQNNIFVKYRFFIFAFFCLIIYIIIPVLSGSGSNLINYLNQNPAWYIILIYLIYRVVIFIIGANSMATGGLMLPTLAIGALSGFLACHFTNCISGMSYQYYATIIIVSMSSLFGAVNKAPLTGSFLLICSTGYQNFLDIFPYAFVVTMINFALINLLNMKDYNDSRMKYFIKGS